MVIKQAKRSKITLLLVICGLFIACQANNTMTNKTSKNGKALAYLTATHKVDITELSVSKQKNAGNVLDDAIPYIAKYKTDELTYRTAVMSYLDGDEIDVQYDTYAQELACLEADKQIENEEGDIPFVIYTRIMDSRADKLAWNASNYSIEELQQKIFADAEFQIIVLAKAIDIKDNKLKYEKFHIEIMRRLKEQHIENGSLEFLFLDDQLNLQESRISPESILTEDHPIKKHTLQRWKSIHKIKWYDMVKDRPDKVLKYGKIYEN